MAETAPGRNAPCWCGSGRKYKRCHLDADVKAAAERSTPLVPRARDIFEIRESILTPNQPRSGEIRRNRR
ncbi:MAG: SEC-C domain-containing protein [Bryobacteraceae bacterium]